MLHPSLRVARSVLAVSAVLTLALWPSSLGAQKREANGSPVQEQTGAPNYDLAAQWTSEKVRKLVFDTTVTPRWLETSDRFWYAYQTREGRKFSLVDPIKRTKAPLFDHAKLAATLTSITRIPYDAQHLPFSTVQFVKKDTAFAFDVRVPADANIAVPPKRETTEQ
ncbi:MAG: S9 family peptidase, partial [Vicinamibacterales bacterium]